MLLLCGGCVRIDRRGAAIARFDCRETNRQTMGFLRHFAAQVERMAEIHARTLAGIPTRS